MTVGELRERLFDLPDNVEIMYEKDGVYVPVRADKSLWPVMHKGMRVTLTAVAIVFRTAPGETYREEDNKLR